MKTHACSISYLSWAILLPVLAACASSPAATVSTPAAQNPTNTASIIQEPATAPAAQPVIPTSPVVEAATTTPASNPSGRPDLVIDPCTLVTADEVATVLGMEFGEADRTPKGPSGDWCSYQATSAPDTAVIGVHTDLATENFKDTANQLAGGVFEPTPVANLGDEAYSELAVYVRKGGIVLEVSIDTGSFTTLQERIDAEKKLAEIALARLP